jgi:hypothetical protein
MLKKIMGFIVLILFFQQIAIAQNNAKQVGLSSKLVVNPLANCSKEWDMPIYEKCNTAKDLKYLTSTEKEVIWILNMARFNPVLFLNSVLLNAKSSAYKEKEKRNSYFNSLVENLKILPPNKNTLMPDSNLFVSAYCHAFESGKVGYVGHNRLSNTCAEDFYGECCDYGSESPLEIVISLLIDEGVPSLGHRKIMLDKRYTLIGVSTQPHTKYETNTVLDFK